MKTETGLQLWGGIECTVNRVGDRFHDQFAKGGHLQRPEDLDRIADLGIRTLRYPVLWERTAPDDPEIRDWRFADERLNRLRDLEIQPIVGLVHHGSGPRYTDLLDEGFANGLAGHARAVAERYPWVEAYTPVNEPLTTARFSALYGHWYPHATDPLSFAKALINQVKGVVLSMRAIREVNPQARLVQTDDLGKAHATAPLAYQAEFDNERRWLAWDLLCGRVDRHHPMGAYLLHSGLDERELGWFLDNPCPPDVVGINYYLTSERFLDHRFDRYPPGTHGANDRDDFADVEAVRVLAGGVEGPDAMLREAWERYGLPLAITECHLGCTREEQVRWLAYVWDEAQRARGDGIDVGAVTVWSMFGAHDWCSLLTCDANRYEPGVFDLRAPDPRPTALASAVKTLAQGQALEDWGTGWWERPVRLLYPPVTLGGNSPLPTQASDPSRRILILGERQGMAESLRSACELRGLHCVHVGKDEIGSVCLALELYQPWAVIDLGHSEFDDRAAEDCDGETLATACREAGVRLVVVSDREVFDGEKGAPYVESDPTAPCNPRGEAKAQRERGTLRGMPSALVVRIGDEFDGHNGSTFVKSTLKALQRGLPVLAACDLVLSPTYVPHLVDALLDLLIDGMEGIVHLASEPSLTRADFARRTAGAAGLDEDLVMAVPHLRLNPKVAPPPCCGLRSERAWPMPPLYEALAHLLPTLRPREIVGASPYLS